MIRIESLAPGLIGSNRLIRPRDQELGENRTAVISPIPDPIAPPTYGSALADHCVRARSPLRLLACLLYASLNVVEAQRASLDRIHCPAPRGGW